MRYVDADGHVEESPATFDDKYLDPNFRAQRPRVVEWMAWSTGISMNSCFPAAWGAAVTISGRLPATTANRRFTARVSLKVSAVWS